MTTCSGCGQLFNPSTQQPYSDIEVTNNGDTTVQVLCPTCTGQVQQLIVGLKK